MAETLDDHFLDFGAVRIMLFNCTNSIADCYEVDPDVLPSLD